MVTRLSYEQMALKLRDTAVELLREQTWDLQFIFPAVFEDANIVVTGDLAALIPFADNDETARWIRLLDDRTGHQGTIAMFCILVLPMLKQYCLN